MDAKTKWELTWRRTRREGSHPTTELGRNAQRLLALRQQADAKARIQRLIDKAPR